jgi:hypothetical protein
VPPETGPRAFPLRPAQAVGSVPSLVVLIGEHLERVRAGLGAVGMEVPQSSLRHDVFLTALPGLYGLSPPSGPVWLTSKL